MGIKLVEEVLNYAPPNLTASERLLLVVIAQNANDATRTGWPGMDIIAYRTGIKPESVQKTFKRLADKGIDLRVPLGKGKDGRVVYAHERRQTSYTVPSLPLSPDHRPPSRPPKSGLLPEERADHRPERADGGPVEGGPPSGEGGPPSAPSLQVSSWSPQSLLKDQNHPPLTSFAHPPRGADDETEVVEAEIVSDDKPWLRDDPWSRPRTASMPNGFVDPWADTPVAPVPR